MHIAVCVKQIPDPETPASVFRIDTRTRRVLFPPGQPLTINPFDEQAVEAALRIRDGCNEPVKITALTLGGDSARQVLKHALAMGADAGILLNDAAFDSPDNYATALVLAAAIRKLADVSLVLTGRQAADDDAGVVGIGVAELLAWPAVTCAMNLALEQPLARVTRLIDDGFEIVEMRLPALVTVSNEIGVARKPSLRDTMRAARKPIEQWTASALGLEAGQIGAAGARSTVEYQSIPRRQKRCEFIAGASPDEQALRLAQRLQTAGLL